MATQTPNFNWSLPGVNDPVDSNLWGGQLNANLTSQDTVFAAAGITAAGLLNPTDASFAVVGSVDATKKMAFEVDGLTTATTRTVTAQDASGTMYITGGQDVAVADGGTALSSYTVGDVIYASGPTTLAKLPIGTAGQVLTVNAGATALEYTGGPAFTKSYNSGAQTITSGGSLTLPHSMAVIPTLAQVSLTCTSAEQGYSIGDVLFIGYMSMVNVSAFGVSVVCDATNVNIRFGNNGSVFATLNKTTGGGSVNLTNNKWTFAVRVWA